MSSQSQPAKDDAPRATFMLDGKVIPLVAGMRCHYFIEMMTGLSMRDYMLSLNDKPTGNLTTVALPERMADDGSEVLPAITVEVPELKAPPLSAFFPLLWGLTATYRAEGGQLHALTALDKASGLQVPSSFVETLPVGPAWRALTRLADDLIAQAWSEPVFVPEEPASGN